MIVTMGLEETLTVKSFEPDRKLFLAVPCDSMEARPPAAFIF